MNISKFILRLPKNLRKHKLIQLLLLIFPDSSIQKISFNSKANVFVVNELFKSGNNPNWRIVNEVDSLVVVQRIS